MQAGRRRNCSTGPLVTPVTDPSVSGPLYRLMACDTVWNASAKLFAVMIEILGHRCRTKTQAASRAASDKPCGSGGADQLGMARVNLLKIP